MKLQRVSIREVVSMSQLLIAMLCLPPGIILTWHTNSADVNAFFYQLTLLFTGIICFLFGLSTWRYRFQDHNSTDQTYIISLVILWELPICIIIAVYNFGGIFLGERTMGQLWGKSVLQQFIYAGVIAYIDAALLLILDVILTVHYFCNPSIQLLVL